MLNPETVHQLVGQSEAEIEALEAEIAAFVNDKSERIGQLHELLDNLNSFASGLAPQSPGRRDLKDITTIAEAAAKILADCDGGLLHFKDVADRALKRGFKPKSNDIVVTRDSFRRQMLDKSDIFETAGEGNYRLK